MPYGQQRLQAENGSSMDTEQACRLQRPKGIALAYRVRRARVPGQPAVILVHGLASNLTRWSEFVEHTTLKQRHDLIRVDLRGHGGSLTRRAIGLPHWCDDLAAILDEEGHDKAIVIGHSLGAQVALHFAATHPRRCAGLVLIDPIFRQALHGHWKWLARMAPLLGVAAALVRAINTLGIYRRQLPALDLHALDTSARQTLVSTDGGSLFVRPYSATRINWRYLPVAVCLQDLAEVFRPTPALRFLHTPMLVLLSTGATFANPVEMRRLLDDLPHVDVQTIDSHHWPLTERPLEVRQAIEQWCARFA